MGKAFMALSGKTHLDDLRGSKANEWLRGKEARTGD